MGWPWWWVVVLLAAEAARPRQLLLNIPGQGMVSGKELLLTRTQRALLYLGIPYAAPPLVALRFAAPVTSPWPAWAGILNATEFKPSCMQLLQEFNAQDRLGLASRLFVSKPIEFSEDCLYLNVYTPDGNAPRGTGWPVVIWFHPGDFSVGSPNIWDATTFAVRQKVIVVTAAYRLNIMGFFTTMDNNAPGNYGLMDQVAVMDWVQEHIIHFNGSAKDVTIAGHSAGGVSVSLHLLSARSSGKFHKAIAMSGNFLVPGSIKTPDYKAVDKLAETFYCFREPIKDLMECLRSAKLDTLIQTASKIGGWGPVIDSGFANVTDPFLPGDPALLLEEDKIINKVPIILGFTDMEDVQTMKADVAGSEFEEAVKNDVLDNAPPVRNNETCIRNEDLLVDSVMFHYKPSVLTEDPSVFRRKYVDFTTDRKYGAGTYKLGLKVGNYVPTFLYRFDYKLKTPTFMDIRDWVNVPKQFELPLFWGMPYWTGLSPQVVWNNADKKTSDTIMTLFGNFTKHAAPAQNKKLVQWEPFTSDNPRIFIVDKYFNMSDHTTFDYKSVEFWNDYYPKIIDAADICCNVTETGSLLSPQAFVLYPALFSTTLYRTLHIY